MSAATPTLDGLCTCFYAGRIFRDMDAAAQATEEARLAREIATLYREEEIGFAFGALAAGADIVFAETALTLGIELDVVLPFPVAPFLKSSVTIGSPPDQPGRWDEQFRHCLAAARSVEVAWEGDIERHRNDYLYHGNRQAAARALFKADLLGTGCVMLAVGTEDRHSALAGTGRSIADWVAHGRKVRTLASSMSRAVGNGPVERSTFRPALFLLPISAAEADADEQAGVALVLESVSEAVKAAAKAVEMAGPDIRIICGFGPVSDDGTAATSGAMARLAGARDLAIPPGKPLATLHFAVEARLDAEALVRLAEVAPGVFAMEFPRWFRGSA